LTRLRTDATEQTITAAIIGALRALDTREAPPEALALDELVATLRQVFRQDLGALATALRDEMRDALATTLRAQLLGVVREEAAAEQARIEAEYRRAEAEALQRDYEENARRGAEGRARH